jgi:hypothetical protein
LVRVVHVDPRQDRIELRETNEMMVS